MLFKFENVWKEIFHENFNSQYIALVGNEKRNPN